MTQIPGFADRSYHFHYDELYGDNLLHHERLLSGGKGDEDALYTERGAACNLHNLYHRVKTILRTFDKILVHIAVVGNTVCHDIKQNDRNNDIRNIG